MCYIHLDALVYAHTFACRHIITVEQLHYTQTRLIHYLCCIPIAQQNKVGLLFYRHSTETNWSLTLPMWTKMKLWLWRSTLHSSTRMTSSTCTKWRSTRHYNRWTVTKMASSTLRSSWVKVSMTIHFFPCLHHWNLSIPLTPMPWCLLHKPGVVVDCY